MQWRDKNIARVGRVIEHLVKNALILSISAVEAAYRVMQWSNIWPYWKERISLDEGRVRPGDAIPRNKKNMLVYAFGREILCTSSATLNVWNIAFKFISSRDHRKHAMEDYPLAAPSYGWFGLTKRSVLTMAEKMGALKVGAIESREGEVSTWWTVAHHFVAIHHVEQYYSTHTCSSWQCTYTIGTRTLSMYAGMTVSAAGWGTRSDLVRRSASFNPGLLCLVRHSPVVSKLVEPPCSWVSQPLLESYMC